MAKMAQRRWRGTVCDEQRGGVMLVRQPVDDDIMAIISSGEAGVMA